jgi:hypothetical protein
MKQITDGYGLQFLISRADATHTLHQLALLAHINNCLDTLCSVVPEVPSTNFHQGSLLPEMPQVLMHLTHKCHPFSWFGHIQPFKVELFLLPAIVGCSFSGFLTVFKIYCAWDDALPQQPQTNFILPDVYASSIHIAGFFFTGFRITYLMFTTLTQSLSS